MMEINKFIDHTILKATAKKEDIKKLCDEAKKYDFFSVCVNGANVRYAYEQLKHSDVKVAAVVGFPLGAMSKDAKVFEARRAIEDGASEIDMVINIGALKDGEYDYVENEIREIKETIGNNVLKVIIETCYLKASGGVKDLETAKKYIELGATRLGTSSGIAIVTGLESEKAGY